jgi:hypothetical protein
MKKLSSSICHRSRSLAVFHILYTLFYPTILVPITLFQPPPPQLFSIKGFVGDILKFLTFICEFDKGMTRNCSK